MSDDKYMKIAIMQPYFFPYIGYFQLINAVDKFVIYDDVAFIKQGWINRNRILINGVDYMFSVPLKDVSSYRLINDTLIHKELFNRFKAKFSKQLEQAYSKLPFFDTVYDLIQQVLNRENKSIGQLAVNSLKSVCHCLSIDTVLIDTSVVYQNNNLQAQSRVLDICKKEDANVYINLSGGVELYQNSVFANNGIELLFIKPKPISYKQLNNEFVPWLSIIDVLMFNSAEEVKAMLNKWEFV